MGENFLHEVSVKYSCEFKMARVTLQILKISLLLLWLQLYVYISDINYTSANVLRRSSQSLTILTQGGE